MKVIVNVDFIRVISAILSKQINRYYDLTLIHQICLLMAKHDVVMLDHSFLEANCVAHELEKVRRLLKNGCKFYEEAPEFLKNLLQKNSLGLSTPRVVEV